MKVKRTIIVMAAITVVTLVCETPAYSKALSRKKDEQKTNTMNTKLIVALVAGLLLTTGLQAVLGQGQISSNVQSELGTIYLTKVNIEQGQQLSWQLKYVESALSNEKRTAYYSSFSELNSNEKKALDQRLNELKKTATDYNISLESIAEADLFASNPAYQFTYNELVKVTGQVQNFDPQKHTFIVNSADGEWLMRAISKRDREKWANTFFSGQDDIKGAFYKRLDKLSVVAAKVVPTFKPNAKNFAAHNAAEETLMKKQLDDAAKIKIHQIGLAQANWDIQKNDLDIPQKRYKAGYIWGKDSRDDFAYCRLYQVNIIQDYEGGGKYGASYAVLLESWVVACP